MTAPRRIIIIHPGALGDLVIAAYAVNSLKNKFHDARLDAYTSYRVWPLFKNTVDSWTNLDGSKIHRLFSEADACVLGSADIIVTWMGSNDKVFLDNLAESTGAEIITASPTPPPDYKMHAANYLASTLSELEIDAPADCLTFESEVIEDKLKPLLRAIGADDPPNLLVIHPGSGARSKCLPPELFAEFIEWWLSSGRHAVILEGPADAEAVANVLEKAGEIPVLKSPPLRELATLLSKCAAYVGNDSGVSHLAAAVGAPTMAVFGPTDSTVWGPRGSQVTILTGNADCSPCSAEKRRRCQTMKCFDDISITRVKQALDSIQYLEVSP